MAGLAGAAAEPAAPGSRRSSMPSATAWVISSSHSRSVGATSAGVATGGIRAGCAGALDRPEHPPEHAATKSQAIVRTMHRC
jgi:hypothetical protein